MRTVFSFIVQKRLSQEYENVATDALAYIVSSSERARSGLMKLLHGVSPDLPSLHFRTQQTEGSTRPDMWGFDGGTPRVYIENKFWASLTDNQPVQYLKTLAGYISPAVLLVVVPEARLETVWREFERRLRADPSVSTSPRQKSADVDHVEAIDFGPTHATKPMLAITSWAKLLDSIESELTDEPLRKQDLNQLRALCDAANEEYAPFSTTDLTNQETPRFIIQLNSIVQESVKLGELEGVLRTRPITGDVEGPRPRKGRLDRQADYERMGQYMAFPKAMGEIGAWFGTHLRLWRERGSTPLWLCFADTEWGRAPEVRTVLKPWAEREHVAISEDGDGSLAVGIEVVAGEEPEHVVRSIVNRLKEIAAELSLLPPKPGVTP